MALVVLAVSAGFGTAARSPTYYAVSLAALTAFYVHAVHSEIVPERSLRTSFYITCMSLVLVAGVVAAFVGLVNAPSVPAAKIAMVALSAEVGMIVMPRVLLGPWHLTEHLVAFLDRRYPLPDRPGGIKSRRRVGVIRVLLLLLMFALPILPLLAFVSAHTRPIYASPSYSAVRAGSATIRSREDALSYFGGSGTESLSWSVVPARGPTSYLPGVTLWICPASVSGLCPAHHSLAVPFQACGVNHIQWSILSDSWDLVFAPVPCRRVLSANPLKFIYRLNQDSGGQSALIWGASNDGFKIGGVHVGLLRDFDATNLAAYFNDVLVHRPGFLQRMRIPVTTTRVSFWSRLLG